VTDNDVILSYIVAAAMLEVYYVAANLLCLQNMVIVWSKYTVCE